jgi:CheY-like chemotaxis protein
VYGEGSTFWVEVPFVAVTGEPRPSLTLPPGVENEGRRVLVAESNPAARKALRRVLQAASLRVDDVPSAVAAIECIERSERVEDPYAFVLIATKLDDLTGAEAGRRIGLLVLVQRPVLLLVGRPSELLAGLPDRGGFAGFVSKPFSPTSLLSAIDAVLKIERGDVLASAPPAHGGALVELSVRRGSKVLLAEDNLLNQEVAVALLREVGLDVEVVSNGRDAVDAAMSRPFDLILMDMQMPVLDGLEATRQIRAIPAHVHTPILAMTASVFDEDREKCFAAGMNDHVPKPVEPDMLYEVMARWLPQSRRAPTSPPRSKQLEMGPESNRFLALIDGVHGLSARAGMRAVHGDVASYARLLRQFVEHHAVDGERLLSLVGARNLDGASRCAHSLKGVAGTLGFRELYELAASIESAIRSGESREVLDAQVATLVAALAQLCTDLTARLGTGAAARDVSIDGDELRSRLALVRDLLADDDASSAERYRDLHPAALSAFGDVAELLERQIEGFDFEAAINTIDHILA